MGKMASMTADADLARRPAAVLLDAGGVFFLPDHGRILGALKRAGCPRSADILDRAHYEGATAFHTGLDVEAEWPGSWYLYLAAYVMACDIPEPAREEVHRHLDSEFADAALWLQVVDGCREGLRDLAETGVRLGVVSNADGLMAQRLREHEILQVGPGLGVEVECVIDSGDLGAMKPDPRIFHAALDVLALAPEDVWYLGDMPAIDVVGARRAGLRPFVMDPFGLHRDGSYDVVTSLSALAARVRALPPRFTLASAVAAAEADQLPLWVGEFLASRGSDNATLAAGLAQDRHWWLGPVELPIDRLERRAGPEDDVPCPIEPEEWAEDVAGMRASLQEGWDPPPILVEHRDGRLLVEDGNHRVEALRRTGASRVWAVVWGDDPAERDPLAEELAS
jgi:FMN phosphatase YigB (HAD superfamily)